MTFPTDEPWPRDELLVESHAGRMLFFCDAHAVSGGSEPAIHSRPRNIHSARIADPAGKPLALNVLWYHEMDGTGIPFVLKSRSGGGRLIGSCFEIAQAVMPRYARTKHFVCWRS